MTTDEETIRAFLNNAPINTDNIPRHYGERSTALEALKRLMIRTIPELPEGWLYGYIYGPTPEFSDHKWRVGIRKLHNNRCLAGVGLTFRSASEAAIARIAEEES